MSTVNPKFTIDEIDFQKGNGLVSVVTIDADSGEVLMVAFADREAIELTVSTGEMHYRSRSRGLWHKGLTSGNFQKLVSLNSDCDNDAIVARVIPVGPACHKNTRSCFDMAKSSLLNISDTKCVEADSGNFDRKEMIAEASSKIEAIVNELSGHGISLIEVQREIGNRIRAMKGSNEQ
jgi:phosphoribosyl-AMP cyclohydrolase